jgi:hypothetical protein
MKSGHRRLGLVIAVALLAGAVAAPDPLLDAVQRGDATAVRALLRGGAEPNTARGDGLTALHVAAQRGSLEIADLLLDALVAGRRQFTLARDNTMETLTQSCFPNKQDYESGLTADEKTELVQGKVIDQTSSYFRSTIWVTIGTTQFTLYSLLYRSGNNGLVRPILRSHGTP